MSMHAAGTYETTSWEENAYDEYGEGRKLTRAHVSAVFQGDIQGSSTQEYLMSYGTDAVQYIGMERVVGSLGGRSGSFVLQHNGTAIGNRLSCDWNVVPGSGTDALAGLRGAGGYTWNGEEGQQAHYTLEYDFDDAAG
ncbi:MAG TPA: DUF3224 domain-containing protein [Roseiflexaceae bacterium]|jgi:hypothetical protein|nr:DUF3224 domain-containing protein [Roseiflexaceae bacterium]